MYIAVPRPMAVALASRTSGRRTTRRFTRGYRVRILCTTQKNSEYRATTRTTSEVAEVHPHVCDSEIHSSSAARPVPRRSAPVVSNGVRGASGSGPAGTNRQTPAAAVTTKRAANANAARRSNDAARMPVSG